jgi:hypothetical protein
MVNPSRYFEDVFMNSIIKMPPIPATIAMIRTATGEARVPSRYLKSLSMSLFTNSPKQMHAKADA